MRLIDADALMDNINERIENMTGVGVAVDAAYLWALIYEEIKDAPTIEPSKSTDQKSADVPIDDLISRTDAIDRLKALHKEVEEVCADDYDRGTMHGLAWATDILKVLPSADRPTLKQTDTLIIADALRYLIQDTERHELDRTRAEELRGQILQYGAGMCHSADRPQVNSAEWVAQKEREFEELNRPTGKWVRYKRCDSVGDEIYAVMEAPDGKFFCNQCGKSAIRSDFCPNCGADMKGVKY